MWGRPKAAAAAGSGLRSTDPTSSSATCNNTGQDPWLNPSESPGDGYLIISGVAHRTHRPGLGWTRQNNTVRRFPTLLLHAVGDPADGHEHSRLDGVEPVEGLWTAGGAQRQVRRRAWETVLALGRDAVQYAAQPRSQNDLALTSW